MCATENHEQSWRSVAEVMTVFIIVMILPIFAKNDQVRKKTLNE